jgi:[ribosomal protein S5]-alanine N-acetyltransferase
MKGLKGNGFILRNAKLSDAKEFFECEQDEQSRKGFMSTPKNVGEVRKSIIKQLKEDKKKKPSSEKFAIEIDGETEGWAGLHDLNQKQAEHKGIIVFCLHKKFRGRGIMSKAVKLVTNYAFKRYKLKRLSGWCRTFNKSSARTMEKEGYRLEGIMRKNKFKDRKYLDDMIWAKVR